MPLQVVGKRAEEHVTSDSIIGLVVDGPYFELHGLETAERLLDQAQLFIGGDYFASSHLLFGHLTTNNVTAVEEFFGHDLVLVKAPGEPSIEHIPADEFTHLGTLQHPAYPCSQCLCAGAAFLSRRFCQAPRGCAPEVAHGSCLRARQSADCDIDSSVAWALRDQSLQRSVPHQKAPP